MTNRPAEKVPFVYSFSGKSLTIGKHKIRLGIPEMNFIKPKSQLRSHIVIAVEIMFDSQFLSSGKMSFLRSLLLFFAFVEI
ncbi:MAG: type I-MYXAN CRISPR-associated protein Cas6/Cmx6 [Waterburya sp.]